MRSTFSRLACGCLLQAAVLRGAESPDRVSMGPGGARAPAPETLTLARALDLARRQNWQLANAALDMEIGSDRIAQARTYRYPQLNVYGIGGYLLSTLDFQFRQGAFGVYPGLGPIPGIDTTINSPRQSLFAGMALFTEPLSQQYRISLRIQEAEVGRRVDQEKLRARQQAVCMEVKRVYFGLVQAQSELESSAEALGFARELERITQNAVAEGTALRSDEIEAQARVAKAEYDDLQLRDALATGKERLNALLGRDLALDFSVEGGSPSPVETSLEAARAQAIAHRPELRQATLGVQEAGLGRREKKAEYIPDISLAVSQARMSSAEVLPPQVTTAGLLAQWDVFDWGRRRREVAAADKALQQARNAAADAEAQVLVQVGAAFRQLQQSRLALQAASLQLAAEREKLRVALNSVGQDFSLRKDLLQQQAAAAGAKSRNEQALLGYLTAQAEFENAIGAD
jgi:outer membrane protein TolC